MKNGYIYSANVDVYYPDIKFVYDTTKIEMSQYYLTVIIYGIILNIILHFVEMPFLAWIKHMNGFQKGFWRYDR